MRSVLLCLGLMLFCSIAVRGQSSSGPVEVSGVVLNASEEVVPGAKVILRHHDGSKPQTIMADAKGRFHFSGVVSGDYEIEVQKEAFKPAVTPLSVGARAPAPLRI